ncbi:MAG: hypothetical protein RMJ54_13800 [Roseiflexaceae bacterium]|nr:hypothetical protein [Roseiflexaceae bacterium]
MNIAIDPDVFRLSFYDSRCQVGISEVGRAFTSHRFFRDDQGVLEKEYRQMLIEKWEKNPEHPSVVLLQRILSEDGDDRDLLPPLCSVRDQFLSLGCSHPVEPELLGMLANGRDVGLVLGLVGYDAEYTRPRGLHKENIRWQIRKIIPWLDVVWIGKSNIDIPESDYSESNEPLIRAKSKLFEPKSALYLQSQDNFLRCIPPPAKGDIGGEQIDVYGYRTTDGGTTVVVGECKLRRCGNESKLVEAGEIQQLQRKVIAAQDYETKRNRGKNPIHAFEGILITNATGLDESAIRFVQSEQAFRIHVLRVTLSSDWETSDEWRITNGEWLNFESPDKCSDDNLSNH